MAEGDRQRWDERWAARVPGHRRHSSLVQLLTPYLPASGKLLDVAGGGSGDAVRFAEGGLDVTVVDVSEVGLDATRALALEASVNCHCVHADLDSEPLPPGPWDVIGLANYLQRDLFPRLVEALAEEGVLGVVLPTSSNLERNQRPSERFLVDPGELPGLVADLEVLHHSEAWRENGRHEAWLTARRD